MDLLWAICETEHGHVGHFSFPVYSLVTSRNPHSSSSFAWRNAYGCFVPKKLKIDAGDEL